MSDKLVSICIPTFNGGDFIRETLCEGEYVLTEAEVAEVEQIEQTYLKEEFINLIQQ